MWAPKSTKQQIGRYIELDKRGILYPSELIHKIANLAVEPDFFECLDAMPLDVYDRLVWYSFHNASAHPEDCFSTTAGIYFEHGITPEQIEATMRQCRQFGYWCMRLLREHFFPELPHPIFEPVRHIGTVSDTTVVDNSVVLFGV